MINKTIILILGATGGIGGPIAKQLAGSDTTLILHGNEPTKLRSLANELKPLCKKVKTHQADLSDEVSTKSFASLLNDSYLELDWIINAAGYIDGQETKNSPTYTNLTKAFNINTLAPIHITQTLQPKLNAGGGVIMLSSTASLWGNPDFPIYAATKGALNTFTLALAKQFKNTGKTAMVICPGGTNTPMREKIASDSEQQQSPDVIATEVKKITDNASEFKNGDIVIIKDGEVSKH